MLRIKEGFKDERFVSLPDTLLDAYAADPLVGNLYLRKIGYFPRVKYHYVLKQQGCDYAMLLYCTEGEGWYRIDGRRYPLRKNQYAVLPPEVPYELGADNENPWTIYWLHFKGRDCRCYCPDGHAPRDIQPGSESRIQERLNLFEELYQSFSLAYTIDYMRYTSACLHHLLASFLYAEPYDSTRSRTDHGLSFSGQVIRYMEEHIGHRPSLEELAAHFRYSPSHFSMLFQRETGMSPIGYLLKLKIQRACQYIELSDLKIREIAQILGFDDPAYFSRLFTRIMGIPPSAYRMSEKGSGAPLPRNAAPAAGAGKAWGPAPEAGIRTDEPTGGN